jgi:signal transduction histidine kinase
VEVLWRAEKSKSRVTEGSGLGLSVVKSIARAHTGNIRIVDGPEGQGTAAVVIFIPLTSVGFYPDFTCNPPVN